MDKKYPLYIFVFCLFFSPVLLLAQNEENQNQQIPEGMEEIQIGGSAKLIVPEGAKTRKVGAQIIVEGTKEYMSRRFSKMRERLEAIEENQKNLADQIEALKAGLEKQGEENEVVSQKNQQELQKEINTLKGMIKKSAK